MAFEVESYGLSDVGLVRPNNEDVWAALEEFGVYVVADGMGGHQAGEVASKEAADALLRIMKQQFRYTPPEEMSLEEYKLVLAEAIELVNVIIFSIGKSDASLKGMGTTLVTLCVHPDEVILGHVGDSRIYRLRDGELKQMTKDNTLATQMIDQGFLEKEDTAYYSYKNVITKAIGNGSELSPTVNSDLGQEGDIFLLCSDGLTDMLTREEIQRVLAGDRSIEELAKELVDHAKQNGGFDNITVLLVKLGES